MKELSIEEKAKRFDEALGKARRYYDEYKTRDNILYVEDMEDMFPELKESEDERIRKALVEAIRHNYVLTGSINHIPTKDILAWLEKQGKQKTVDEIAKEVCKNKESAMAFLKLTGIINEKGELADEYKIEQDEQNPVWSEEDEDYYDAIISKLEVTQDDALLTDNQMEFLKSIKDRVQPQNSIVTDEELAQAKKDAYNNVLDKIEYDSENPTFDDGWSAAIWYLKKRNAQPQSTLKPSDEQMEGIECTIKTLRY